MFENKMGAHPFRIQSTSNGSTGTQWNVGVTNNDVSNGVLIFEVPLYVPIRFLLSMYSTLKHGWRTQYSNLISLLNK